MSTAMIREFKHPDVRARYAPQKRGTTRELHGQLRDKSEIAQACIALWEVIDS